MKILWVGFDRVKASFINEVDDVDELADSLYDICPEIVDQGTESIERLIELLEEKQEFSFWWD